jgi:hypothetical protein
MGFETKVLNIVDPLLDQARAEFVYGTLFLEDASEAVGRKVFHALSKKFGVGKVTINVYTPANGFSYDFVA